jgi:hypothetical protein
VRATAGVGRGQSREGAFDQTGVANSDCYFKALEIEANVPLRLLPVPLTAAMMATAMAEAMRPYSMAVAPDSSLRKVVTLRPIVLIHQFAFRQTNRTRGLNIGKNPTAKNSRKWAG